MSSKTENLPPAGPLVGDELVAIATLAGDRRTTLNAILGELAGEGSEAPPLDLLDALTLTANVVLDGAAEDTVVGVIANDTAGSALDLHYDFGGRFKIVGHELRIGPASVDIADVEYPIAVAEDLDGIINSPRLTPFVITVAPALPLLVALTLSANEIEEGSPEDTVIGVIGNKTGGSGLALANTFGGRFKLVGLELRAGAAPLIYSEAASYALSVVETAGGYGNSPNPNPFEILIGEIVVAPGTLSSFAAIQTSAPGSAPFSFKGTQGDDIFPGYFLEIERSASGVKDGTGSYVTKTLNIRHQLTQTEHFNKFIPLANLTADGYIMPSGTFFEQYRWARDDGTVGPRTELTDTIAASTAVLATANGVNKRSSVTVTGDPALTATGNNSVGAAQSVRAMIQATTDNCAFEFTVNTAPTGSFPMVVGLDNGTTDFNLGGSFVAPGRHNAQGWGIVFSPNAITLYYNSVVVHTFSTIAGVVAAGDVFKIRIDKIARTIGVKRFRTGGIVDYGVSPALTAIAAHFAFFSAWTNQSVTFNFGRTAPQIDDGANIYG